MDCQCVLPHTQEYSTGAMTDRIEIGQKPRISLSVGPDYYGLRGTLRIILVNFVHSMIDYSLT